jgi:hypothetical protein
MAQIAPKAALALRGIEHLRCIENYLQAARKTSALADIPFVYTDFGMDSRSRRSR